MKLYFNPVSSYSQKVLLALYEKGIEFEPQIVNLMDKEAVKAYKQTYPIGKVPFLTVEEEGWEVPESSIIIEYLDQNYPQGLQLLSQDPQEARQIRCKDRMNDLYMLNPAGSLFFEKIKPKSEQSTKIITQATDKLNIMYALYDKELANREYAHSNSFTLADCSAIPALYYAQMNHSFDDYPNLTRYYQAQSQRASYQKILAQAEPILASFGS